MHLDRAAQRLSSARAGGYSDRWCDLFDRSRESVPAGNQGRTCTARFTSGDDGRHFPRAASDLGIRVERRPSRRCDVFTRLQKTAQWGVRPLLRFLDSLECGYITRSPANQLYSAYFSTESF
jgi:hypothetical protein